MRHALAIDIRNGRTLVAVASLLGGLLLLGNTALSLSGIRLHQLPRSRYWDDLSIAIGRFEPKDFQVVVEEEGVQGVLLTYETRVVRVDFPAHLERFIRESVETAGQPIRPWEFWRVVPFRLKAALSQRGRPVPSVFEDPGRSWLLGTLFRLRGGIAPFLLLWLAPLLAVPLLVWCALALFEGGFRIAGALFAVLVASSAFALGALYMTHSATGFYLLGILLLVGFSALPIRVRTRSSLLIHALLGGLVFALCVLCRGGTLLLLPAFLAVLALGAWKGAASVRSRLWVLMGASTLFVLPLLVAKPPERHSTWIGVWEGLGDFDREKGYAWDGSKAESAILGSGGRSVRRISLCSPFYGGGYEFDIFPRQDEFRVLQRALVDQEDAYEAIARDSVLRDIRHDPFWYLNILGHRLFSTVTLRKLWPWGPRDGISMEPSTSPNEGSTDHYYHYTPEADMFVLLGRVFEVPVFPLLSPFLALVLLATFPRLVPSLDPGRIKAAGGAVAIVSLGALILPVLITTAGGQETEAFVLVHLLSLALLADILLDRALSRRKSAPSVMDATRPDPNPCGPTPG